MTDNVTNLFKPAPSWRVDPFMEAAPLDDQEDIQISAQIARQNLEQTILTHIKRASK